MRRGFPFPLIRVFVLAGFGVGASIWALDRAYRPRPPMVVPTAIDPSTLDAAAEWPVADGEIVAPDLLPPGMPSARE